MAKKAAAKHQTTPSSAQVDLAALVRELRELASDLEQRLPVLKVDDLGLMHGARQLTDSVAHIRKAIPHASILPLELFNAVQAVWSESWQVAKSELLAAAAPIVGKPTAKLHPNESDDAHRQRVLVAILVTKHGEATVRQLCKDASDKWREQQAKAPPSSHVKDPEAHAALKRWGDMTEEQFLASLPSVNKGMLARACNVVALKPQPLTSAKKRDLYRRARRFYINTQI